MCSFLELWSFEKLDFKVQTSFEAQNFVLLLSLSLHSSSSTFKLLSMASYGGELLLDSSSPWSGVSNHLSSISIPLPSNFKKQRTQLMKKIQGLQAPMELHHPISRNLNFLKYLVLSRKDVIYNFWRRIFLLLRVLLNPLASSHHNIGIFLKEGFTIAFVTRKIVYWSIGTSPTSFFDHLAIYWSMVSWRMGRLSSCLGL